MRRTRIAAILAVLIAVLGVAAFAQEVSEKLAEINKKIAHLGIAIHRAEYYVMPNDKVFSGRTLYAGDHTLTMITRWVPYDPYRLADEDKITYMVYTPWAVSTSGCDLTLPVADSFETWAESTNCTELEIVERPYLGGNPSAIFGGYPFMADITIMGFLPGSIFDLLEPGGSNFILGVTFTFVWIDGDGNPTDFNHDGKLDTALKEIWFNDAFYWVWDAHPVYPEVDIETVALHENGHGLELDHFGSIFRIVKTGKLKFAPRAVMNAAYAGVLRKLLKTDKAAFCSIWASWPKPW